MKIALFAATGTIGRQIAQQALQRGHQLTALVRSTDHLPTELQGASIVKVDASDAHSIAAAARGHDALASAFGPGNGPVDTIPATARTLILAARESGVKRLVVVGGAGSLEAAPGIQLVDTPDFPAAYKPQALAHRDALSLLRRADHLNWTFFAPAAEIGPGVAHGNVHVQPKVLRVDADGHSRISYPDYAAAFIDELENGTYIGQVVTAAY